MFLSEFFRILFWIFALFGLFCALKMLCGYIILKNDKYLKTELVLKVKNDEETIENTVRILAEEIFFTAREKIVINLVIVDMGCDDSTMEIAKILQKEYSFIRLTTKEEYFGSYD